MFSQLPSASVQSLLCTGATQKSQFGFRVLVLIPLFHLRGIQTDLDLNSIGEDEVADVLPDLLTDYAAELKDWTKLASEHWKQGRMKRAEDLLSRGITCRFRPSSTASRDPI